MISKPKLKWFREGYDPHEDLFSDKADKAFSTLRAAKQAVKVARHWRSLKQERPKRRSPK